MSTDDEAITGESRVSERYHDRNCLDSPVGQLSRDNLIWLSERTENLDTIVRLVRVFRENPDRVAAIMAAVNTPVKVKVLKALQAQNGSATYDDLTNYISGVSRKTVKRRVWELRDADVVEVGDGKPAVISWTFPADELIVPEILSYADSSIRVSK